jgi:hypothetical protein
MLTYKRDKTMQKAPSLTYHDADHSLSEEWTSRVLIVAHADRPPLKFFQYGAESGCVSGTTFHIYFSFSSTYSESSIMRSTTCSTGRPAKFLSTNSLT